MPAPWKAHGRVGRAHVIPISIAHLGRRAAVVYSLNKHSFLVSEKGSKGNDDMVSVLKWLGIYIEMSISESFTVGHLLL